MQGALEWLEKNQDKSLEDIQAEEKDKGAEDDDEATQAKIAELETGQAKSMVCNECAPTILKGAMCILELFCERRER